METIADKCCEIQYGLSLTKQALSKRLELGALLLKEILTTATEYAASHEISTEIIEVLKQFKDVRICDSTIISLSDKLKEIWKGLGGKNAKAALKIQSSFSVIKRKFLALD